MATNFNFEHLDTLIQVYKDSDKRFPKVFEKHQETVEQLAEGIRSSDLEILNYILDSRNRANDVMSLLKSLKQDEAAMVVLSNLQLSTPSEVDSIFANILDVKDKKVHSWMLDYDIPLQRLEMINSVVVPYMREHYPNKKLFANLKRYEATVLNRGGSQFSSSEVREIIDVVQDGKDVIFASNEDKKNALEDKANQLIMPNRMFNALLRLAWTSEQLVTDLFEKYGDGEVLSKLLNMENVIPTYLVITDLGYPMGGGESFMHQTCRVMSEFGIDCVWVSYHDSNANTHSESSRTRTPYYLDIRLHGGRHKSSMEEIIVEIDPDLLHAQGGTNDFAMEIAEKYRISSMIGYHFWHGLIELGKTSNQHIIQNIEHHSLREPVILQSETIQKYVASEFMLDVYQELNGQEKLNVVHALSDNAQFLTKQDGVGKFILQINVSELKGGTLFLDCLEELGAAIPFMGVKSENDNTDIFTRIESEINKHSDCVLETYGNVREFYKTARMVLVPTLVDETFCRVAFEAAMNGIPVLTTSNGYIPQMLGPTGIYLPEDSQAWIKKIDELYNDLETLKSIGEAQRKHVQTKFNSDFRSFNSLALDLIHNSRKRNIGIFTVWSDNGLGNLCHTYAQQLRRAGYNVHVFSFQSYVESGKNLFNQKDKSNWEVPQNADSVYYSYNVREEVSVNELTQFLLVNKIDTLLVPEVCWSPNWERLLALDLPGLKTCVVPMIEIAIEEELQNHNKVTSVLHCTRLSEKIMEENGIRNGGYIGHGYGETRSDDFIKTKQEKVLSADTINFLHVAGHNPVIRKNTPQVIDAFKAALDINPNLRLTVTSMLPLDEYYSGNIPEQILIVDEVLSKDDVTKLYETHDVSIQVSSHEGLGLGFYESISCGTPVITMNCPPHNEVIIEGSCGWLIPCQKIPVPDNNQSLVFAHKFNNRDLAELIARLDHRSISEMISLSHRAFSEKFDELSFLQRFIKSLPQSSVTQGDVNRSKSDQLVEPPKDNIEVEVDAAPPPSKLRMYRSKFFNKLERMAYAVARPVSRGVVLRLRNIIREEIVGLRHEFNEKQNSDTRALHEMVASTKEDLVYEIQHSTKNLTGRAHDDLSVIRNQLSRINRRLTSYAGENTVLTYLRDGSAIFVNVADEGSPLGLVNNAVWEPENTDVLYSFLKPDSLFVDVGANLGYFSISMAKRLSGNGRVVAIEPHPKLQTLFKHSLIANSLENKVDVLGIAASDKEATIDLYYPEDHLGKGSAELNDFDQCEIVNVKSRRLDDIFNSGEIIDIVKIDVEGHELSVFRGMRKILKRSPDIKILYEKLGESQEYSSEIYNLITGNGLRVFGVGPFATLIELDKDDYFAWVGDVLAVREVDRNQLSRRRFKIYPEQLSGNGMKTGDGVKYVGAGYGLLFDGPNWYLEKGRWQIYLSATSKTKAQVSIYQDKMTLGKFDLGSAPKLIEVAVSEDLENFSIRCLGTEVNVEHIEFVKL